MRHSEGIRRGGQRYTAVKRMLRLAAIDFVPGESKGWGFWVSDRINMRTGSTWHSPDEARRVVKEVRGTA